MLKLHVPARGKWPHLRRRISGPLALTVLLIPPAAHAQAGAVGAIIIELLSPVFIPWMVFDKRMTSMHLGAFYLVSRPLLGVTLRGLSGALRLGAVLLRLPRRCLVSVPSGTSLKPG
jgi:hypothetical protein